MVKQGLPGIFAPYRARAFVDRECLETGEAGEHPKLTTRGQSKGRWSSMLTETRNLGNGSFFETLDLAHAVERVIIFHAGNGIIGIAHFGRFLPDRRILCRT